jgi:hypothetical protein
MGIGLGIVLIVLGLVLVLNVVTWPDSVNWLNTDALGWILLAAGVLAIALVLIMNAQRSRTTHIEERRYDRGPRY